MKICTIKGCARVRRTRGYCGTHYQRWRAHGDACERRPLRRQTSQKERERLKMRGRMRCCTCRKVLSLSSFPLRSKCTDHHKCYDCYTSKSVARRYNLTKDQYWRMLARQGNRCAICNTLFGRSGQGGHKCCIDHDHADGKVRGLLCSRCNVGIGNMRDSPALLYMAARYLDDAEARKKAVVARRINKKRIRK